MRCEVLIFQKESRLSAEPYEEFFRKLLRMSLVLASVERASHLHLARTIEVDEAVGRSRQVSLILFSLHEGEYFGGG